MNLEIRTIRALTITLAVLDEGYIAIIQEADTPDFSWAYGNWETLAVELGADIAGLVKPPAEQDE